MDSQVASDVAIATPEPSMSVWARSVAIFTRPTQAWVGLKGHVQWWFPVLVMLLFAMGSAALLHQRAIVPMMQESWDRQVASGAMQPEQVDRMEKFFSGPTGLAISVVQQAIVIPIITVVVGLLVWFGVGFVLGTGMKYRLALEVAAWASLISLPNYILTTVLAWMKQTMRGVHTGFGILLPEMDPPSKFSVALGAVLDGIGPLAIWYLIVAIIGAAYLSGAPKKTTAWTLTVLYLVLVVFGAALAAMFTPAA